MTDIKTELTLVVPRELSLNLDFWMQLNNNISAGFLDVPTSFLTYLHRKYGYSTDILNTAHCRQHIVAIGKQIQKSILSNPNALSLYSDISYPPDEPKQIYSIPKIIIPSKPIIKSRSKLILDTPLAIFS